ncbi:hypothetical protein Q3G72_030451 [Acer saccharum]|nr:hypothetical protein Q3G72_030451 [Acer saccharum]
MSLFKLIFCAMIRMNTLSLYKFVRLAFCSINAAFFLYKFMSHMNDQGVVTHLSRQMRKRRLMRKKRLMRKEILRLLAFMQIMLIMMQIMFIMLIFVQHYWIPEWFSKWMEIKSFIRWLPFSGL